MRSAPSASHDRATIRSTAGWIGRRSLASVLLSVTALAPAARSESPATVDFRREILPILSENCFLCHGPDSGTRKADLRLDLSEGALRKKDPVIVAGKGAESEVFLRIASHDPDEIMPPPKSGKRLTPAQVELVRKWIDQGASWSRHWAFETPKRPAVPSVSDRGWVVNPIDAFVLHRLESEKIGHATLSAKATLCRRVTLDLTGLPPTPGEVDAFVADASPDAYDRLVDRLLDSPAYGERMAMEWLDAARYADTNGYQNDFARSMWPWRDWVIAAYNANKPFDRFTVEQLAGDLLPGATLDQRIATGFNRNNRTVTEAGSIDEEWRVENGVDRVETTATVFLGLTMGCCRCHDHKYDPISQEEFYRFFGFFNSLNEKGVYTETRGNVPPMIRLTRPGDAGHLEQFDLALAVARAYGSKKHADILAKERKAYEAAIPSVMVMEERAKPRPLYPLKRGQYDHPDRTRPLQPGTPACLPPLPAGTKADRLALARWLVSPEHPLTARVEVNRIWQHHFGIGLVKTAENFGVQGDPPSHPELLDWLATELIRSGWDLKAMHRLIVTSATYRQDSRATADLVARDPENRLLAHGPRFRLSAEVVRDNALVIAGLLAPRVGGRSVKPYQPAGLWEELAGGAGEGPYVQDRGSDLYRRSLYVYRKRTVPHPSMANFDAPSREICQVRRARTNTPLQALELLNDVTYVEAARSLGQLMILQGGTDPDSRIMYGFRRALARRPTRVEYVFLLEGLERYRREFRADPSAADQLVRHGESPIDPEVSSAELAAYTTAAAVILNLDETITQE